MTMEHQFDALIRQLRAEGWSCACIASRIGRSEMYVSFRVGVRDPLGAGAFDPGPNPPTMEAVFRRHPVNSHKPGGWDAPKIHSKARRGRSNPSP